MSAAPTDKDAAIRELMVALEALRTICEHTEGRTEDDEKRLELGMRIGIRANAKFKHLIPDYQSEGFWADVYQWADIVNGVEMHP